MYLFCQIISLFSENPVGCYFGWISRPRRTLWITLKATTDEKLLTESMASLESIILYCVILCYDELDLKMLNAWLIFKARSFLCSPDGQAYGCWDSACIETWRLEQNNDWIEHGSQNQNKSPTHTNTCIRPLKIRETLIHQIDNRSNVSTDKIRSLNYYTLYLSSSTLWMFSSGSVSTCTYHTHRYTFVMRRFRFASMNNRFFTSFAVD